MRAVVEAPELLAAEIADEENAVSDETELMSAVSVEEKRDVSVSEAPEAKDFDAEEENTAELILMLPLSKKAQRKNPLWKRPKR